MMIYLGIIIVFSIGIKGTVSHLICSVVIHRETLNAMKIVAVCNVRLFK